MLPSIDIHTDQEDTTAQRQFSEQTVAEAASAGVMAIGMAIGEKPAEETGR